MKLLGFLNPKNREVFDMVIMIVGGLGHVLPVPLAGLLGLGVAGITLQMVTGALLIVSGVDMALGRFMK